MNHSRCHHLTYTVHILCASLHVPILTQIHRIGQTSKTYIHRYIIEDTIEVKIDRLRAERQSHDGEEEEEDAIKANSETTLRAGGLDGGFNENELQELLK